MTLLPPPRPDALAWIAMGVSGVLSFALLVYAMRRMRSRDRFTVVCWTAGSMVCAGAGQWSLQGFALASLMPAAGRVVHGGWLMATAIAAAGTVVVLQWVAARAWPLVRRCTAEAAAFSLGWWLQFETMLRALPAAPLPSAFPFPGHASPAVLALVLGGAAAALWVFHSPARGPWLNSFTQRVWAAGTLVGLCATAGEVLAIASLRLPDPAGLPAAAAPFLGVEHRVLEVLAVSMLVFVVVGLMSATLDRHAVIRHRALRASLDEATRRLRDQALSDPLTRMPNRLMFEERLAQALESAGEAPCSLAVLFIDLDGFKPINDSFGHVAGDEVLREVGRRLVSISRAEDIVARVGGDEFLLMTQRPGHEAVAAAIAQRVLEALGAPFALPAGIEVSLSASIGVVMYPEHGPSSKLIANADAAMYAAKRAGGSTWVVFEPRMELDSSEQLSLQQDLRHAVDRGELALHYQPKVHAGSGLVTGVEALLRWRHPTRGYVPPDQFIVVAERFGLIGSIGNWVIDEACRQLREWQQRGLRMRIAVNLSVHQLRQDDLVQRVRVAVGHFGVDPQLLTFEITESVAMEDTQETMRAFSQLASTGVTLAIDDFGTGYSSLSYLRRLPARQLKIDKSFVQDLGQNTDALAVVDAVIKLAHALGLSVVAEGVETTRQRDILISLHCDELQGYLFARPMSAEALTRWAMGEDDELSLPAPAVPTGPMDRDGHAGDGGDGDPAPAGAPSHGDFRPSLFVDSLSGLREPGQEAPTPR